MMATRIGIFTVALSIAIVICVLYSLFPMIGGSLDVLFSIIPVSAAVIFGTQRDLLQIWLFWKPRGKPTEMSVTTSEASAAFTSYGNMCVSTS
ncbi:hypothetical protein BDZ94DRAFT_144804 [Collybia nuda]|uniref:Uncharacterized protein n=1 Tax=Collybia nuda TaxID=64659 RepID=A0A9P6CEN8_9AGAR|nr:hypothetical protein BDZ94DRAFT_144804 [Collybia nuda]